VTLIDNTKFPAATVNSEFDKLTILAQQSAFLTSTSLQIPSYEVGINVIAAPAVSRANKLLLWDASGNLSTIDTANIIGGSVPAGPAAGDLAGSYPNPTIKASVGLTGVPTAATAAPGVATTQIASTAFVAAAVAANGFRRIARTVPTAAQATVDFTSIPSDINSLMFEFDVTPTTNAQDFVLQFYNNLGVLDATGPYGWGISVQSQVAAVGTGPAGVGSASVPFTTGILFDYSVTNRVVGNVSGIRGTGRVANIRDARFKYCDYQSGYVSSDASVFLAVTGNGYRGVNGAITGLRFLFSPTSTFAAGGAITLWGSP
jgi:hypothetical protein